MHARATIDDSALAHNLSVVRERSPGCRVYSVVKANGYGHGLEQVARALSATDGYGVARLAEAVRLRDIGLAHPVMLLEGVFSSRELRQAVRHHFDLVVHNEHQLRLLEDYRGPARLKVWLKVDTGMGRLGISTEQVPTFSERLGALACVQPGLRFMTHFASADDPADDMTAQQIKRFAAVAKDAHISMANSAGILAWPKSVAVPENSLQNWVRAGLMLYGVAPVADTVGRDFGLRPVMTLTSQIISVRTARAGTTVGYGATWQAEAETTIAVAAAGYGDGVPWHGRDIPVLVNGVRARIIGRVSMDMVSIDVTNVPQVSVGDPVCFWGAELPVEDVARHVGTIPYTLLCGVTQRARVP